MGTFYLDFENGNDSNDGTSYANRWKTINSGATAARIAPNDTIRVMASPDPTSLGINVTFTNDDPNLTLASALNALVTDCDTAWTASANVTASTDTFFDITPTADAQLVIAAGFTTGKVAYFGLGSAQDFSGYQGLTFWAMFTAIPSDGTFELRLCSDTTGDTAVDTFVINNVQAANVWQAFYIDKGAALGASIQSIALYATVDPGSLTVRLDNINTTKAAGNDCLHLLTLIGKSGGADGGWYPIRRIEGTTVEVCSDTPEDASAGASPGFFGTTESVTGYIRPVITVPGGTGVWSQPQEDGADGSLITFSGGWNRTDMSTQTGDTYVSNHHTVAGTGFYMRPFNRFDKIHPVGWQNGFHANSQNDWQVGTVRPVKCSVGMWVLSARRYLVEAAYMNGCRQSVVIQGPTGPGRIDVLEIYNGSSTTTGTYSSVYITQNGNVLDHLKIGSLKIRGQNGPGLSWFRGVHVRRLQVDSVDVQYCKSSLGTGFAIGVGFASVELGTVDCRNNNVNFLIGSVMSARIKSLTVATPTGTNSLVIGNSYTDPLAGETRIEASSISGTVNGTGTFYPSNGWAFFENYNGVANDHRGFYDGYNGARLYSETGMNRHTPSGIGWRIDPLYQYYNEAFPVMYPLARNIVLEKDVQSRIRLWVRRSNANIYGKLRILGGMVAGIVNDVEDVTAGWAGVWEQLELLVTPTAYAPIDIWLEVWGGTAYSFYFDDFEVL